MAFFLVEVDNMMFLQKILCKLFAKTGTQTSTKPQTLNLSILKVNMKHLRSCLCKINQNYQKHYGQKEQTSKISTTSREVSIFIFIAVL